VVEVIQALLELPELQTQVAVAVQEITQMLAQQAAPVLLS
jgi:hypothetical protein